MIQRLTATISATGLVDAAEAEQIARIVLPAMRQPTQKMILGATTLEPTRSAEMVKIIYQAAIDGAMK